MNGSDQNACGCTPCTGSSCNCGCQNTAPRTRVRAARSAAATTARARRQQRLPELQPRSMDLQRGTPRVLPRCFLW